MHIFYQSNTVATIYFKQLFFCRGNEALKCKTLYAATSTDHINNRNLCDVTNDAHYRNYMRMCMHIRRTVSAC